MIISKTLNYYENCLDAVLIFHIEDFIYGLVIDGYGDITTEDINSYLIRIENIIKKEGFNNLSVYLGKTDDLFICASICFFEIKEKVLKLISYGDCRAYLSGILLTKDDSCLWKKQESLGRTVDYIANISCENPLRRKIINK